MTNQNLGDCILRKLIKYEKAIMIFTLGNYKDEYNEEYIEVYGYEWRKAKINISEVLKNLLANNIYEEDIMVGILLAELDGIMTYQEGHLCLTGLKATCSNILEEIKEDFMETPTYEIENGNISIY